MSEGNRPPANEKRSKRQRKKGEQSDKENI